MKKNLLPIVIFLSMTPIYSEEEIDLESLKTLSTEWLNFSQKEESWLLKDSQRNKQLLIDLPPERAISIVVQKFSELYKKTYGISNSLVYYFGNVGGGNGKIELYQVKIYFYLNQESRGAPLVESFLVKNEREILLQRRGKAEK